MNIVITMAGLGSRFRNVGYNTPKFMIEAKGKTLFEWSMDSLLDYNNHVSKYVFVVRKEDHSSKFIKENCLKYGIKDFEILEIDYTTDGQATTCFHALPYCNLTEELLIYNIDTYVEPYEMKYADIKGLGYIPCFHAEGDHWSFVKLNEYGRVIEIKEKVRISDNCTLGAYYFATAKLYKDLYEEYYSDCKNNVENEKYVAPLYNYMIQKGLDVKISLIDKTKVHVLGTPDELKRFLEN